MCSVRAGVTRRPREAGHGSVLEVTTSSRASSLTRARRSLRLLSPSVRPGPVADLVTESQELRNVPVRYAVMEP